MTFIEKILGLSDERTSRLAARVLLASMLIVAVSIAVAVTSRDAQTARFFDNVYWTVGYIGAALLARLGARMDCPDRRAKVWFARALTAYALGQVLWDFQVALGWNPFPGPSDAFFLLLGPLTGVGCLVLLLKNEGGSGHRTALLDSAGLCLAVLALTLAMYLPKRGETEFLPLIVLVAYPVVLCWAASAAFILTLALRLELGRGLVLFLSGLFLNSILWLKWNSATLDGTLGDGTLLNTLFPLGALAQGTGVLLLQTTPTKSQRWERFCEGLLRLLPLFIVVVCAAGVVLVLTIPSVPAVARWSALFGSLAVVCIATLRQSLLLGERERLVQTERELRKAEETFRALVEQASDGIFIASLDGFYLDVNPSGAEMLGMTRSEVVGKHISEVVAPEDVERIGPELDRLSKGETLRGMWHFRRKDGSHFTGEVTAKSLSDGRLQGVVRDVSERLALEARLRQSQKMEAMGVLAAGIAHDFNNLLTTIRGNVALAIEDTGADHPAAMSLTDISVAAERATDVVQRILAFSRPVPTTKSEVQLGALVEEVLKLLRSSLPAGIELVQTLPTEAVFVEGDASQIHQVLMNLCTNAWQALGAGPGRIEVALSTQEVLGDEAALSLPSGSYACVSVTDDGSGMRGEVLERIFEPFFTTKAPGEGTGLGLSVAHGIVHGHGGTLRVESSPGQGSTFRIYLPRRSAQHTKDPGENRASGPLRLTPLRVAYVDDEFQVAKVTMRLLERLGYSVTSFGSAASLLSALREGGDQYDVIVTDYNMPRMSGIELARALHERGVPSGLVLTSGYLSDQLRSAAEEFGIVRFVQKPETIEGIAHAIEEAARKGRAHAPAATGA